MATKEKIGTVVSNKMEKTIVITVEIKSAAAKSLLAFNSSLTLGFSYLSKITSASYIFLVYSSNENVKKLTHL